MNDDDVGKIVRTIGLGIAAVVICTLVPRIIRDLGDLSTSLTEPASQPASSPGPAEPIDWPWLTYAGIGGGVLVGLVLLIIAAVAVSDRRHRASVAAEATQEARAAQLERWDKGAAAYGRVALAVTEFETAPATIFDRPLLLDTTEPDTGAFFAAFHEAGKLHLENVPRDEDLITAFVDAALAAETAFDRADLNARAKAEAGITHNDRRLTPVEQRTLVRARGLLNIAFDPSSNGTHARNAFDKASELLSGIVDVPMKFANQLTRSIEAVHRGELTSRHIIARTERCDDVG